MLADDGSEDTDYLKHCAAIATERWDTPTTVTQANRKGIGGSLNLALKEIDFAEFWMYSVDDWVLTQPLDLEPALRLIREGGVDYVRLNPMHPNLVCTTKFNETLGWWLDIHHGMGGFSFATRPFIATKNFYKIIGPFKEGVNAYEMEQDYAERVSTIKEINLAALIDLHGPWKHVGVQEVGRISPAPVQTLVPVSA